MTLPFLYKFLIHFFPLGDSVNAQNAPTITAQTPFGVGRSHCEASGRALTGVDKCFKSDRWKDGPTFLFFLYICIMNNL